MGKVDHAVQVSKALQGVMNQSIPAHIVHCQLKNKGEAYGNEKEPII